MTARASLEVAYFEVVSSIHATVLALAKTGSLPGPEPDKRLDFSCNFSGRLERVKGIEPAIIYSNTRFTAQVRT